MGLTKVNGQVFKEILFSNKRIKATTYDGLVVYIPLTTLGDMIFHTQFDVTQVKENFLVVDYTFNSKEK